MTSEQRQTRCHQLLTLRSGQPRKRTLICPRFRTCWLTALTSPWTLWLPNLPKLETGHPNGCNPFFSISSVGKRTNCTTRRAALPRYVQEIQLICLEERNVKWQQHLSSRSMRCQTAALSPLGPPAEESVPNADIYALHCADVDFIAWVFLFSICPNAESPVQTQTGGGVKLTSTDNEGAFA